MFKKLSQKFKKPKELPEYKGPIQKRITLLTNIHNLAVDLISDCKDVIKTFNQDEGLLHNLFECFSINAKLLGVAVRGKDDEYAEFMIKFSFVYDQIGRAQRKFEADLKEQVINPLQAWILTDYARMNDEIQKLHDRKREMDKAKERAGKAGIKREELVKSEQASKGFERQMEIAKTELLKLTTIKNEHAGLFYNFLELYKAYHETVVVIMDQNEAEKWAQSIAGMT